MPTVGFVPLFPIPESLLRARKPPQADPQGSALPQTRRRFLLLLAALPLLPLPAHADRTGKYSTKLTAKRRYLPRIKTGVDAIRAAAGGGEALQDSRMEDLLAAMGLFATTYFSEGNRVAARERELSAFVDDARKAWVGVKRGAGYGGLVAAVDGYVKEAGLAELAGIAEIGI